MEIRLKLLGNLLRETREANNLTQEEMGQILGIAQTTLGQKERGGHGLRPKQMEIFEKRFGIDVNEYLKKELKKYEHPNCNEEPEHYISAARPHVSDIELETMMAEKDLWKSRYDLAVAELKRAQMQLEELRKSR